ncbi:MAG: hypothetical protein PHY99_10170, partial [Bacteroidales bacterium]|nr:hypothetical protein [Bacteroidales bacterium]
TVPVISGGTKYFWSPDEFSWRMGLKDNAGHQGYHGLKGHVNDDIFQFGNAKRKWPGAPKPVVTPEPGGTNYYLWSTVFAEQDQAARLVAGGVMPASIRVNGKLIENVSDEVKLKKGSNTVVLRYSNTGTGYLVFTKMMASRAWNQTIPLSTKWYTNPDVLIYDCNPEYAGSAGWFRFNAPPGLKSVELATHQKPQVWVNGIELPVQRVVTVSKAFANPRQNGWKADLYNIAAASSLVAVRVRMDPGEYGGAVFSEPIRLNCGKGVIRLGDLQDNETLRTYSGGMWYRKTVNLTAKQTGSTNIDLDLGELVSSAEVFINGISAGKRLAPPWKFNLNGRVKPGENKVEILIYNTLGNFYLTVPTEYAGSIRSGLIGPVKLIIE